MVKKLVRLLVFSLFAAGCSLDYSSVLVTDDMSEEIPDSILLEFSHTSVKNGLPMFRLYSGQAYIYNQKEETQLSEVVFQEFDSKGDLITEGKADRALFFTDTENAEFWGDLYFYSLAEEASFSTTYLYWNSEEKKLIGKEENQIVITRDTGTEIRGTGFEAEARSRTVHFSGAVIGSYVQEEDEENDENIEE